MVGPDADARGAVAAGQRRGVPDRGAGWRRSSSWPGCAPRPPAARAGRARRQAGRARARPTGDRGDASGRSAAPRSTSRRRRWLLWSAAALYLRRGWRRAACSPGRRRSGWRASASLHALAARRRARPALGAAARARRAGSCSPTSTPCAAFAAGYRRRLCQTAWALLAAAHAVNAALIAVFTAALGAAVGHAAGADGARAAGADVALVRVAAAPDGRHRALLRRGDAAPRDARAGARRSGRRSRRFARRRGCRTGWPATRRWPARSRWSRWWWSAGALFGFDAATAGRLLGASALMLLAMALYVTLLLARRAAPAAGPAGGAAPPAGRRDPRAADAADQAGASSSAA